MDQHIAWLDDARIKVGIASWWGVGCGWILSACPRTPALANTELGSLLKWTVYYEAEGHGDPGISQIQTDLAYLSRSAASKTWAVVNGKPVIFVYGDANDGCVMADRWKQLTRVGTSF